MENDIRIFEHKTFGEIRAEIIDGIPMLFGVDVATALGYKNTRDAIAKHVDDDDKMTVAFRDGRRVLINESGFYSLVFSSKLEQAKDFKKWVTSEVLPSIRKTGGYMVALPEETNEELLARALLVAEDAIKRRDEKIHELEVDNEEANKTIRELERDNSEANKTIRELRPKAELMEKVIDTGKSIDIGQAANFLKLPFGRNTLFKKLREKGILFKERNEPKQKYIDQKLFELKEKFVERSGYNSFVVPKVMVTQKGMEFLYKLFKEETESKQIVLEGLCQ